MNEQIKEAQTSFTNDRKAFEKAFMDGEISWETFSAQMLLHEAALRKLGVEL